MADPIEQIAGSVGKIEGSVGKIAGVAEDAATYPILTKEVNGYDGGGRNGDSPVGYSAGSSPTRTAQETIRRVLGWRYRGHDTKGFLAALNRAFDLKDVEGHVEWDWKPQNYMVQADLGEITGAQASILTRAKVAVEHAQPLLEGLTPLREEADDDEMEAVRAIIRSALNELLREFGATRGPRVQRVDDYFDQLLGSNPDPSSPEKVGGHLGVLRLRFGLERERVNTIAEEQNLTNALILVDYVITLKQTWDANRRYFNRLRKTEPFLGTQLVLLSQALEVVAESVREAYDAMDSVFFGALERQTTEIPLEVEGKKQLSPMTIAELLGWVEDFATAEARQLIQEAGKDGVVAARRTLRQLRDLVKAATPKPDEVAGNPAIGFHTNRVRRALEELQTQLVKAHQLAADVRPAVLSEVQPSKLTIGRDPFELTLIGDGLNQDGKVFLRGPEAITNKKEIEANSTTPSGSRLLIAQFNPNNSLFESGVWDVVFAPDEGPEIVLEQALLITVSPPSIIGQPQVKERLAGGMTLEITGKSFRSPVKVVLKKANIAGVSLPAEGAEVKDGVTIRAVFKAVIDEGEYTVEVMNPDSLRAESDKFTVKRADLPFVSNILPTEHKRAPEVTIVVSGAKFGASPIVTLEKGQTRILGTLVSVTSAKVEVKFDLSQVEPDTYELVLTNEDNQSALDKKDFKVNRN